ncbi:MAG: hypothetical protein HRT61_03310 [Ekhidna sp.]|nr:hypothetical protein [Ekhidna sp.]
MSENKITTYLLYAIGEIFLVVIGILIAVNIDDWYREKELANKELKSYQNILADLRVDSIQFQRTLRLGHIHQKVVYQIYYESIGEKQQDSSLPYDFIAITKSFLAKTQENHQRSIDQFRNDTVRNALNKYFTLENRARESVSTFNKIVVEDIRPYAQKNDMLALTNIFDDKPMKIPTSGNTLKKAALLEALDDSEFISMIAGLRMTMGYFLFELELLIEENRLLIDLMESEIKSTN